jgi:large repetitive protein
MRAAVVFAYTFASASVSGRVSRALLSALVLISASLSLFAQNITVSPATLTFASQAVGSTSAAKNVTVTNQGASSQAVVFAPSASFSETDNCNGNIAAGASCKVSVYFSPALVGKISGALNINDPSNNLLASVSLTGTGVAQTTLMPATLAFGNQEVNVASAAKTATFKNNQPGPVTISSITISGGTAPGDYAMSGNCPISPDTLAAGKSCSITVTLTPSGTGSRTATLTVTHNAPTSPQTVSLTGTGVEPVTLSASSLPFGTVLEGNTSAAKLVTLTNNEKTALTFTSIATTGDFAIASNTCGASVAAGAACKIGVTFSPTATGALTGTLVFTDSAPSSPQIVSLTGTGSAPVTILPVSLNFVSRTLGTTSPPSTVTLTNHLATSLTMSTIVANGDFSVASNTCGSSVGAGLKCTIGVTFTPTEVGTRTGALTISYDAFGSPSVVNLKGTGNVTGLKSITVTPTNPSIALGATQQFVATGQFSNGSTANLTDAVTWSSSVPGVASISATGLASAIGAGQTVIKAASGTINGSTTLTVTSAVTYTIGGTVSGLSGSGLVLLNNGGNNLSVAAGATSFTFSAPIPAGSTYNVTVLTQPSNPAQTCVVTNGSGTANGNVTNVQVTCTTTTYTIGGTVSGLSGSGLVLQNNGGNNLSVAAGATSFTFSTPIPAGSTYNVTVLTQPSNPAQTCTVTNGSGTANGNVTNIQVTCTSTTYTIGGSVSGLSGSGLVLQDNGGNNLTVAAGATSFTFSTPIPAGSTYNVTVLTQPSNPAQTCVVTNGSGTANGNVTNVQVTCTTTTYTIGGTVSGLSGSGLVLQDNGGNNLTVASGATSFTFSAPIPAGSTYNVTVLTQPSNPTQTCVVTNGSGTATGNVTNVQVTCTTYTASATLSPTSAHQGSSETIVITGTSTNFGPTTTVNFGADITTGTVSVNGPTSASVPITIDNVAATGQRNVTITTGSQVVTATFTVVAGVPTVTMIAPNTIQPAQTESVTITGAFTSWVSGTTKANFGPGIAVGGAAAGAFGPVTVNSATSLTSSLVASGASNGFRTVQIQTGSQTLTVNNGMFIGICNGTTPTVLFISPVNAATSVPLNTQVQVQFSVPMNRSRFSLGNSGSASVFFYDAITNQEVPGTISIDASGTIATITPSETLPAGRQFVVYLSDASPVQDSCGDKLPGQQFSFTTAFGDELAGPTLTGNSPENGDTSIPLNAQVVVRFNDQLDPITAQTGFSMTAGGNEVPGTFTYSTNDETVTFTPATLLTASTIYTVNYTAQITDTVGNPLANPGSFSFETGTSIQTSGPFVTQLDPPNGTLNVGLNVNPHVLFSEPVNELTIPTALSLSNENGGPIVPATVMVAANRLSATITPSASLLPNTEYGLNLCGYTDIAGNSGYCLSGSTFVTGTTADTSHVTVSTIIPSSAQTGVPLNVLIVAVMSNTIDPTSITNSSITVTPAGGSAIAGTVTLASDGVTLTFSPSASLTASKVYTISVGGFADIEGNSVTPFTSKFTAGTSSYGASSFTLSSTTPANKATGVSVTSPVTFTMSNLIDAASVNTQSVEVEVCFDGAACTNTEYVAGTYSVNGTTVTFTPLTQYPANTVIGMYLNGLMDEAGNLANQPKFGTFTTASTVDQTAPTVTIAPSNGTTNVGLNAQVVLTFSKSINTSTITGSSLAAFSGNTPIDVIDSMSISQDNRTITLSPGGMAWTPGAISTIELTSAIQDLSGNSLANTTSQFTLTTAVGGSAPSVVAMRPGNGATNVPANTAVTLFTSAAMNPSTVTGALFVTDNGVPVTGAVQLFSNAQAIEFTPANSFNPGDLIQVFLNSTAQGANGVTLNSFSGQFTVAGSPANTAAAAQAVNPFPNATNVPLNTIIQVEFNQPLQAGTVTCSGSTGSVTLYQSSTGTYLTPNCTVIGGGQVINIGPTANLASGSQYQVKVSNSVTNTDGLPVQAFISNFTAGTAVDNAAPTIVSEAPINNASNIGTNTFVSVNFNKAINPISVSGSTIQLSGGSVTEVPSSVSFTPNYTRVTVVPQAPLPPSTVMTLAVKGVTSQAGNSVATTTTTFTTAAQPDFSAPYVINSSVQNGQTNVPVNSAFSMQFSKPMDIGSFNPSNVYVSGGIANSIIPTTISWSADQTTIFLLPSSALNVGDGYSLCSASMTDLDGNPQQSFCATFTAAFTPNTNPPTVVNTSPENTLSQVPTNSPVVVLFSEPIQPTSIGQITLNTGGNAVAVIPWFTDANQLLTLTPTLPLLANASYTITITGVKDTAGNQMTATVANTFTTGATFDLNPPSVVLSDPAPDTIGVGTNVAPRVEFSKRLNPLSVVSSSNEVYNQGSVQLLNSATGVFVPVTVSLSSDRTTATLTPTSALTPNTQYELYVGESANYYDVAGNIGVPYTSDFTTNSAADTASTTVTTVSPVNKQTSVPVNAQIAAVMSDSIDPTTVTNSSITVTPSGGSAIAGTVTLASDGVTLTFVPSASLTKQQLYNVSVGGFNDVQSNPVKAFASSFTTGNITYGSSSFTLVSTNPVNGANNISVTSTVTITMSNQIDPASVNTQNVEVAYGSNSVAGTYTVSGATITFTPLTPYPANATMNIFVNGVMDLAGNIASDLAGGSFTTASTPDTTPPTVTITPSNGTANLGLNTQVVLTFSESINPMTISRSTVNLLNGDVPLNPAISISADNRTVVLNSNGATLPAGATITATASHLITDLSGNALADTTSQFTTMTSVTSGPSVVSSRPANGATNVPASTVITLFTSGPMNAGTIPGALYVSQNGVLVSGTTAVGSNGQSIEFAPSSTFTAGTPIQVFLNSTAQDIYGNNLTNFAETFTIAGALANTAATAQAVNPFPNATSVPLNTIIQVEFNQPLQAGTVTCNGASGTVTIFQGSTGTYLTPNCTVIGGGQVINIAPSSILASGSTYKVSVTGNVTNTSSVPVQAFAYNFTAGTGVDNAAPTIVSLAPPNSSTNVGTNAAVSVNFNKAINPVSVTGSSIQLSGGSITETPSSISFTPDFTRTTIIPQAPLPSSTQMAIAINGVTSEAGVAVASQTTHFTTLAGPDVTLPYVVHTSVASNQYVGTNAAFAMQFDEPMDPGSLNPAGAQDVFIYDTSSATYIATAITFSSDLTTVMLKPTANLTANHQFQMCSNSLMDLSGNPQQNFCLNFYTGAGTDTTGPVVLQASPPSGFTGIGINSWAQILFNGPIDGASIGGATLQKGSSVIATTATLFDGDQGIQLLPLSPLTPNTTYTVNVAGVLDITGNPQVRFPSQSFTTGTGTDLVQPTVMSTNPANLALNVPVTTAVQVVFSKAMDPASFDPANSFTLVDSSLNTVPATITFSPDYTTATLQPTSNLTGGGATYNLFVSYFATVYDLAGNRTAPTIVFFTTQ